MKKIIDVFKEKNIACGYLYFYIHFITEIVCFFFLTSVMKNSSFVWLIPFLYDAFAFVPQGLIGYYNDKHKSFNSGLIGVVLLVISYLIWIIIGNIFLSLFILCFGNAFLHISGAENTLRVSNGKLSHSAIFVGGGSFGVITGKILSSSGINPIIITLLILTMIPFILLSDTYKKEDIKFDYNNKKINPTLIVLLATFVVIVRGYVGYGIPTSWNKTITETALLFITMGVGKCLGGILSDAFGVRKVGIISILLSIPFLCFGDNYMIISLVGVMMFSMTMAITLSVLVSVLKDSPGLAFGFTTIGLFLGTVPIFFFKINSITINIIMIVISSIMCSLIISKIIRKE